MNVRVRMPGTGVAALATCCLVMASCASVKPASTPDPVPTAVAGETIAVPVPPETSAPRTAVPTPPIVLEPATIPPPTVSAPAAGVPAKVTTQAVAPVQTRPARAAPPVAAAETPAAPRPAPTKTGAQAPASAAPSVPPPAPKAASTSTPAPRDLQPARAPLDLDSLGARLKQTRAIGVLTKLSLKNQVDDLLAKFRAYHSRQGTATLPELRRSYDMLLLKVLSLLQDSDPPLARDIVQSRAAIWGILADPKKFNEASLMAGAST